MIDPQIIKRDPEGIERARRTLQTLERMLGHKLNIVVVEKDAPPQISMVRPFAKPWFTPEEVKAWNDKQAWRKPSEKPQLSMKSICAPIPRVYDVEATVTPVSTTKSPATSPAELSPPDTSS